MTGPHERPKPFRAAEHVVDALVQLISRWGRPGPGDPPIGSSEYATRLRDQARALADRTHSQAFAEGVQWAMERQQHREQVGAGPDPYAVRSEDLLTSQRPGSAWSRSEPDPLRMSAIRPQEYQPDRCPHCNEHVTGWTVQYPLLPDGSCGPAERVLLDPCRHSVKFVDDTLEENFRVY